jgi:hypothetical protein
MLIVGTHHLILGCSPFTDVGQGYDIALGEKDRIVATQERHPNDLVTSFYMHTPSDILLEYGWDRLEVDRSDVAAGDGTVARYSGHHGRFDGMGPDGTPPMPMQEGQLAPL